jgi:hypothetical protein
MEQIYAIDDFNDYNTFFQDINLDKKLFINYINNILHENSKICNFNYMISYIRDIHQPTFNYIVERLNKSLYHRTFYIYIKFLLLDNEKKDYFYNKYILQFISLKDDIKCVRNVKNIISSIFSYVDDIELINFMEVEDIFGNLLELKVENKENIKYNFEKYMNNTCLSNIEYFIDMFDGFQLIYRLTYYLSDRLSGFDNQSSLNAETISKNACIDFHNRFFNKYVLDEFIKLKFMTMTSNLYYEIHNPNTIDVILSELKKNYPVNTIVFKFIDEICNRNNIIKYSHRFEHFYKDFLHYNIEADKYKLYEYSKGDILNISHKLYDKHKSYLRSELVYNLRYIYSEVYCKLINKKLDQNLLELKEYLDKVFEEYHYHKLINF